MSEPQIQHGAEGMSLPTDVLDKLRPQMDKAESGVTGDGLDDDKDDDDKPVDKPTEGATPPEKPKKSDDGLGGDDDDDDDDKPAEKPVEQKPKEGGDDDDDEDTIIGGFKSKYGEVEGIFEDTTEGLESYFDKVLERREKEAQTAGVEDYLKANPAVAALDKHLKEGYQVGSFLRQQQFYDYNSIKLEAGNEESEKTAERLYRAGLNARGLEEDEIELFISNAKDNGNMIELGEKSKVTLNKIQQKEIDALKQQEQEQLAQMEEENKKTEAEAKQIIKGGNLLGLKLVESEARKLEDFALSEKRQAAYDNLSMEEWLLIDMMVMNKFKSIGAKAPSATTKQLKDLKKKSDKVPKVSLNTGNESLNTKGAPFDVQGFLNTANK